MSEGSAHPATRAGLLPGAIALAVATLYLIANFAAEKQPIIIALLAVGIVGVIAAHWLKLLDPVSRSFADRENALGGIAILAAFAVVVVFHEDHFILLLATTVLLTTWRRSGESVRICRRPQLRRRVVLRLSAYVCRSQHAHRHPAPLVC